MKKLLRLIWQLLYRFKICIWAFSTSLLTLLMGAVCIGLADLGGSAWIFIALLFWLGTIGLPTTLAALLVTSLWGRIPGLSGFIPFVACAAVVGLGFQTACFLSLARLRNRASRMNP